MNVNAPGVRSPHDQVGGIVYFGRMLDKIRLQAKGQLHEELQANLGKGFDERILQFLRVDYDKLKAFVLGGASDLQALEWCFQEGRRPDEIDIEVWNEFMRKRGWNDSGSPMLKKRLLEGGFTDRTDILTMFDFIDLDEGRDPALKAKSV